MFKKFVIVFRLVNVCVCMCLGFLLVWIGLLFIKQQTYSHWRRTNTKHTHTDTKHTQTSAHVHKQNSLDRLEYPMHRRNDTVNNRETGNKQVFLGFTFTGVGDDDEMGKNKHTQTE